MLATILLPTTGDRGPLLEYSAGSVLRQSVKEIELFIVGDGVNDRTKESIRTLELKDNRVRFFDFPKHSRRGEVYRHEILQNEAAGEIVCYICDRDLMLSDHVAEAHRGLKNNDIVSTLCYQVKENGGIILATNGTNTKSTARHQTFRRLSCVAHTLEAYRSLPFGWRTTPTGHSTDKYMWKQFLDRDLVRAELIYSPTILYFRRGGHPGWPTERRREELLQWYKKLIEVGGEARIHHQSMYQILQSLTDFRTEEFRRRRTSRLSKPFRKFYTKLRTRMNRVMNQ